mmetsp:Transcript_16672/g.41032  ORF Transcript_16672/g.41032 Transcript_16672/m.41032 type:complete len:299 (-) Transcript_16672:317-1213(-)
MRRPPSRNVHWRAFTSRGAPLRPGLELHVHGTEASAEEPAQPRLEGRIRRVLLGPPRGLAVLHTYGVLQFVVVHSVPASLGDVDRTLDSCSCCVIAVKPHCLPGQGYVEVEAVAGLATHHHHGGVARKGLHGRHRGPRAYPPGRYGHPLAHHHLRHARRGPSRVAALLPRPCFVPAAEAATRRALQLLRQQDGRLRIRQLHGHRLGRCSLVGLLMPVVVTHSLSLLGLLIRARVRGRLPFLRPNLDICRDDGGGGGGSGRRRALLLRPSRVPQPSVLLLALSRHRRRAHGRCEGWVGR